MHDSIAPTRVSKVNLLGDISSIHGLPPTLGISECLWAETMMDAGTLYMRVFMGAKPFESSELDSLAEKMNVRSLMSKDAKARYFVTRSRRVAALSLGNKVLFGSRYYLSLTDTQRLAVVAHEFGHLLARDSEDRRRRVVAPSALLAASAALSSLVVTRSALLIECVLAVTFLASVTLFSAAYSEQYHEQEMRSDRVAASFVDGQALVEAIQAAESLLSREKEGGARKGMRAVMVGVGGSRHPAAALRVEAIRRRAATAAS
jgi:Zn-dependent protease with chaperone function